MSTYNNLLVKLLNAIKKASGLIMGAISKGSLAGCLVHLDASSTKRLA